MNSVLCIGLVFGMLLGSPSVGWGLSAVFSGDPVNPATGLPYEILPGFSLVLPGPDGLFGTADDTVDASVTGDIDLVVRSGSPPAAATIPPPTAQAGRAALPVGVAGSPAGGGIEVPFTVFLSDGATSAAAPSGHLQAAPDMDGVPVVVAAFADLDGDGFIGPTNRRATQSATTSLEVRELEAVGRAAALFSGGVARGSVAIRAGLPASQGGLTIVLTALALTAPFDPGFFDGSIPSGPGIATALPFFPQRDLARLLRDRVVPVGPATTLQHLIQLAALPPLASGAPFALPVDGSAPTIDVALVSSQPAVRAAWREDVKPPAARVPNGDLSFGMRRPANRRVLRLVPVDRWGNAGDPPPGFAVTLRAVPPLTIARPRRAAAGAAVALDSAAGIRILVKVPPGTADGTTGLLTVERNGTVDDAIAYRVDSAADQRPDIIVPSRRAATIQDALAHAADRNHDGAVVIAVKPGVYRENVIVNRSVVLRGGPAGTTIVQGDGSTSVLSVSAPNATIQDLTAVGGTVGFALTGASATLVDARATHNVGAGITVSGNDARIGRATVLGNGADGVFISGALGAVCSQSDLFDNAGVGLNVSASQNALIAGNRIAENANGGLSLTTVGSSTVTDNLSANNFSGLQNQEGEGAGIGLFASQNNEILGNLCALNDNDGLHVDTTSNNLIAGNAIDSNHGYGLFVRRSTGDDFSAATGLQAPPGDNRSANNRKGDVFVRTN